MGLAITIMRAPRCMAFGRRLAHMALHHALHQLRTQINPLHPWRATRTWVSSNTSGANMVSVLVSKMQLTFSTRSVLWLLLDWLSWRTSSNRVVIWEPWKQASPTQATPSSSLTRHTVKSTCRAAQVLTDNGRLLQWKTSQPCAHGAVPPCQQLRQHRRRHHHHMVAVAKHRRRHMIAVAALPPATQPSVFIRSTALAAQTMMIALMSLFASDARAADTVQMSPVRWKWCKIWDVHFGWLDGLHPCICLRSVGSLVFA